MTDKMKDEKTVSNISLLESILGGIAISALYVSIIELSTHNLPQQNYDHLYIAPILGLVAMYSTYKR
ncbi:MAG: hypothetical protein ABH824_03740 [Nanoarchaeota archaeon]|nr:hypothetical protein [Nanoarchaeota archaeon]MBU1631856.1 hypothetical protein [Nanoarchaeota archaeon]MBU1875849.1 hypothetical protein [Nanoarchaeota archaeon]